MLDFQTSTWLLDIQKLAHSLPLFFAGCYSDEAFSDSPILFIYQDFFDVDHFLVVLSLLCCARAFSSCGEQGLLFIVAYELLITVASLIAEHSL